MPDRDFLLRKKASKYSGVSLDFDFCFMTPSWVKYQITGDELSYIIVSGICNEGTTYKGLRTGPDDRVFLREKGNDRAHKAILVG
jgi:hypothetical protein